MQDFLRKAFELATSAYHSITHLYDQAGYLTMCAIMDRQFMAVDAKALPSEQLRFLAQGYEFVKERAQASAFNQLETKLASGDFGPKPDIKPPLFRALGVVAQALPRLSVSQSAVLALGVGVALVGAHLLTHGHFTQNLADSVAIWMGAHPNSRGPAQEP